MNTSTRGWGIGADSRIWGRWFRISIALAGLLMALQVLSEPPRVEGAVRFSNEALEEIRLRPSDGFEVVSETSVRRKWLFKSEKFKEWFDNKHIWIHWQALQKDNLWGSVQYVEFRCEEDAKNAKKKLDTFASEGWKQEIRVCGTFTVLVGSPASQFAGFEEAVFDAIDKKLRSR